MYKLSKPEEIFMNAMAGYLETQSKADKIEARAKSLASMGGFNFQARMIIRSSLVRLAS